jgi:hypothetical protein
MKVYRFQNTMEIETNSYCEDIMNIYLSYKGDEETEITTELVDEIYDEWGTFIDWRLSTPSFEELSVYEWVEKILSFNSEEEAHAFQMTHKMPGVFAIEPTDTLEKAFELSVSPEMGIGNRYLIEAEAELLEDFGKPFGMLVKIETILKVIETPLPYVEQALAN